MLACLNQSLDIFSSFIKTFHRGSWERDGTRTVSANGPEPLRPCGADDVHKRSPEKLLLKVSLCASKVLNIVHLLNEPLW